MKTKEINKEAFGNIPEYITTMEFSELSPEERKKWRAVPKSHEKVPLFSKICFVIAGICLIVYIISMFSESFADLVNFKVGAVFRFILAKITNILPFSLAEFFFILLIPGAIAYIVFAIKYRTLTWKMVISTLSIPVSIVAIVFSLFVLNLGTGYRTPTLDKKLEFEETKVTEENLYASAEYLVGKLNELSTELEYDYNDFSKMPYSFDEMNDKLLNAYEKFCEKYDIISTFDSKLKPVMSSEIMSYMHTLGIYTFFTGEANINVNFPEYTTPYTSAHELAHQRGIAREDEANMVAFLVCMESDDTYIRYSAYLNMYEYVTNALWSTNNDLYRQVSQDLDYNVKCEQIAYSNFYMQYQDSGIGKVSSAVNDTFLKVNGTEGEISYGLVVELTVAYFKTLDIIE